MISIGLSCQDVLIQMKEQSVHKPNISLKALFLHESQLVQEYWKGTVKVSFQALQMNTETSFDQLFVNSSVFVKVSLLCGFLFGLLETSDK